MPLIGGSASFPYESERKKRRRLKSEKNADGGMGIMQPVK